jgi:hypothetical protein
MNYIFTLAVDPSQLLGLPFLSFLRNDEHFENIRSQKVGLFLTGLRSRS